MIRDVQSQRHRSEICPRTRTPSTPALPPQACGDAAQTPLPTRALAHKKDHQIQDLPSQPYPHKLQPPSFFPDRPTCGYPLTSKPSPKLRKPDASNSHLALSGRRGYAAAGMRPTWMSAPSFILPRKWLATVRQAGKMVANFRLLRRALVSAGDGKGILLLHWPALLAALILLRRRDTFSGGSPGRMVRV